MANICEDGMHCHARLIAFGVLVGLALACSARAEEKQIPAKDLTCNVHGGPFVLNDEDFDVLTRDALGPNKFTREQFASLDAGSSERVAICDTRKLWRLIKDGKVTFSDFNNHYQWTPNYFTRAEARKALDVRTKAEEDHWRCLQAPEKSESC
jgi:hypothetical protein